MSELKVYKGDVTIPVYGTIVDADAYLKKEADAVIAKLKDKIQMHDFFWEGCGFAKRGFKNTIAVSEAFDRLEAENTELKQKLEDAKATAYAESMDAGMRERRLKRALYKACANWAHFAVAFFTSYATKERWHNMEFKCLKKAKEYDNGSRRNQTWPSG